MINLNHLTKAKTHFPCQDVSIKPSGSLEYDRNSVSLEGKKENKSYDSGCSGKKLVTGFSNKLICQINQNILLSKNFQLFFNQILKLIQTKSLNHLKFERQTSETAFPVFHYLTLFSKN